MQLLTRLDRYIISKFLGTYFFALMLIIGIAVVFDYNENIDKLTQSHAPWSAIIFDYYLNFIPFYCNLFSPLFVFIAVIFFTSTLAGNSEIIAMLAAGMSFRRLMRPYMISASIIALITFFFGGYIIPKGSITRLDFETQYKRRRVVEMAENLQLHVRPDVVAYIERFDIPRKTGYHFSLDRFEGKRLVSHLTAPVITYDTLADERYHWIVQNYTQRDFVDNREVITRGTRMDTLLTMEPTDFVKNEYQEQTLTNPEMEEYIEKQKARGSNFVTYFEVEYHKRIAAPFAAFVLTTIGASLSSRKRKGGMGIALGIGLALSAMYILAQSITSMFAINAGAPAWFAVWIPNIIFAAIAAWLYTKAPR
ncbi:MAG: YjgP/YjgQ family permease [Bacteroidaceae bacterium]|nr:YjgP/YjgQ family permease [Bacteroidaceae bacterium]